MVGCFGPVPFSKCAVILSVLAKDLTLKCKARSFASTLRMTAHYNNYSLPSSFLISGVSRLAFVTSAQPVSIVCSTFSPLRCFTMVTTAV
jgi:hypothetical protein